MPYQSFKPAWWLPGPHLQTLCGSFIDRDLVIVTQRERLELNDGDFLDLDWVGEKNRPVVLVLHGLASNIDSSYAKRVLRAIANNNWCGVFMHFRGCSGEPNRLARSYHSGDTADLAFVVGELSRRYPQLPIAAIGYSLGGNVLIKWLGETGYSNPLRAAVAVSIPFEIGKTVQRLNQGFSRLYQWRLLNELKQFLHYKFQTNPHTFDCSKLAQLQTFKDFDDHVTAPLHGFSDAEDYYRKASCRQFLPLVKVPTLIVQSRDDPFTSPDALPNALELPPQITFELSEQGGHVGFIGGNLPWQPVSWLEDRIIDYLKNNSFR